MDFPKTTDLDANLVASSFGGKKTFLSALKSLMNPARWRSEKDPVYGGNNLLKSFDR